MLILQQVNALFDGSVSEISSDPSCNDNKARSTSVPFETFMFYVEHSVVFLGFNTL